MKCLNYLYEFFNYFFISTFGVNIQFNIVVLKKINLVCSVKFQPTTLIVDDVVHIVA